MAITNVGPFTVPNWFYHSADGLATTDAFSFGRMNASGDKISFIVRAPKAGTLNRFVFHLKAVGNNPDNGLRASFQTVDTSTGHPDGTQDQYRDITGTLTATFQVPGLMTSDGTDTGSKRTVALGEPIACVIDFVNFVASDSVDVSWFSSSGFNALSDRSHYMDEASDGSYGIRSDSTPCIALEYDDGTYAVWDNGTSIGVPEITTFASNSNPDERALRFEMPYECQLTGVMLQIDADAAVDVVLYDAASSVIDTISFTAALRSNVDPGFYMAYWPNGPHILDADTEYKISVKPTTTTSIRIINRLFPSSAYLASTPEGVEWYQATRVDGGSWSTDQTRRPVIHLMIDGIELTVTGGGGGATSRTFVG